MMTSKPLLKVGLTFLVVRQFIPDLQHLFIFEPHDEQPTKVGLVGVVGDDFAVYDQMILEKAGLNLAGVVRC